ncbi:transposase [Pigmentibacter sp. JX0631]|uniref:transposase n=1 Tax=Pigmentibacter sp. JX0631 TaxID=2976982 RepID=UPI0024685891|nr:transposase [Pigmentibacter sp. JX0631]WGL61554.1 transposase [Pigmentibacter sp. JX0631]
MADRAYHVEKIRKRLKENGIQAVIHKKKNTIDKINEEFGFYLYKIRHLIENLFARLKQFKSIPARYDKKKVTFLL